MNVVEIVGLLLIMSVLIFLSGWFSGTETAVSLTSPSHIAIMKKHNVKNIEYLIKIKKNLDRTLIAILIGNNLVNILLSSIAALIANILFNVWGVTVMIGVITFLIIVFGEITPKSNAVMHHTHIASSNAKRVYYLTRLLGPFITAFVFLSEKVITITGGTVKKRSLLVSDECIKSLATLGEQEGVIKSIERDIIHKVFTFGDLKIRDIMLPFQMIFSIHISNPIGESKEKIKKHGFTRIPIVNDENRVIGVVYSKDLLTINEGEIESIMHEPFFVPGDQEITHTFVLMKKKRIHMAIVVDEEGNHIGLVTLEDIIEELVGDIQDEYYEQHKDYFSEQK